MLVDRKKQRFLSRHRERRLQPEKQSGGLFLASLREAVLRRGRAAPAGAGL